MKNNKLIKPIILCGDLNCAPTKKDAGIWCLAGCSPEERKAFRDKENLGLVDVFRRLNPLDIDYTWYSNRSKVKDKGLRLDEFLISESSSSVCTKYKTIRAIKRAIRKWKLPIGTTVRCTGKYICETYIFKVIK